MGENLTALLAFLPHIKNTFDSFGVFMIEDVQVLAYFLIAGAQEVYEV